MRIKTLNLNGNKLTTFSIVSLINDSFHLQIENISAAYNQLSYINLENNNWVSRINLSYLNLAGNKLSQIDVSFLVYLKQLDLNSNSITSFSTEFYKTDEAKNEPYIVSRLSHLDFSYNQLVNLPFLPLEHIKFSNMRFMKLSFNRLAKLDNAEFSTMPQLRYLDIKCNRLTTIRENAFNNLLLLSQLDMSSNSISELANSIFFDPCKSLVTLVLSQNLMKHVPKSSIKYCIKVKHLYLNDNRIKVLQNYSFGFMKNLIDVYLSGNLRLNFINMPCFYPQ